MEHGKLYPFVKHSFDTGVMIATFLFVLDIVPRHCARLTYFLHPKLREINAVPIIPRLVTLTLRHLRRAQSIPMAAEHAMLRSKDAAVLITMENSRPPREYPAGRIGNR